MAYDSPALLTSYTVSSLSNGPHAEVRATVTIMRAATGKQETFEVVGYVNPEQAKALGLPPLPPKENPDVCDPQHGGA